MSMSVTQEMLSYALCSKRTEWKLTHKVWFEGHSITTDPLNLKGFPYQNSMDLTFFFPI